jgi:hypothetical protein
MAKLRTARSRLQKPACAGLPYDVVVIEWLDSSRVGEGWIDLADIAEPDPSKCVSVGFPVSENAKGKILVPTVVEVARENNRHTDGGIMIPRCSILSERRLSKGLELPRRAPCRFSIPSSARIRPAAEAPLPPFAIALACCDTKPISWRRNLFCFALS